MVLPVELEEKWVPIARKAIPAIQDAHRTPIHMADFCLRLRSSGVKSSVRVPFIMLVTSKAIETRIANLLFTRKVANDS